MKKLTAYILISIFTASFVADTVLSITVPGYHKTVTSDMGDNKEKETEKEESFLKDKTPFVSIPEIHILNTSQLFYITQTCLLPQPFCELDIIPPEAA